VAGEASSVRGQVPLHLWGIVRTSGAIPNPNEWHPISDHDHDPDLPAGDLLSLSILAWRCAACGRLWLDAGRVKDGKHAETFWEYVPAFDEPGPLAYEGPGLIIWAR
jgi:hypothetical protein